MKTVSFFLTVISAIIALTATLSWFVYKDDISFAFGFFSTLSASLFILIPHYWKKARKKKDTRQLPANITQ